MRFLFFYFLIFCNSNAEELNEQLSPNEIIRNDLSDIDYGREYDIFVNYLDSYLINDKFLHGNSSSITRQMIEDIRGKQDEREKYIKNRDYSKTTRTRVLAPTLSKFLVHDEKNDNELLRYYINVDQKDKK